MCNSLLGMYVKGGHDCVNVSCAFTTAGSCCLGYRMTIDIGIVRFVVGSGGGGGGPGGGGPGGGGPGGGGPGGGGGGGVFRPMVCVNMNSDLPMMVVLVLDWVSSVQMAVAMMAADTTKKKCFCALNILLLLQCESCVEGVENLN
jgi:hypothetical protein